MSYMYSCVLLQSIACENTTQDFSKIARCADSAQCGVFRYPELITFCTDSFMCLYQVGRRKLYDFGKVPYNNKKLMC